MEELETHNPKWESLLHWQLDQTPLFCGVAMVGHHSSQVCFTFLTHKLVSFRPPESSGCTERWEMKCLTQGYNTFADEFIQTCDPKLLNSWARVQVFNHSVTISADVNTSQKVITHPLK